MCKYQPAGEPEHGTAIADRGEDQLEQAKVLITKEVELLLDELSPKEMELAARTNYQYYYYSNNNNNECSTTHTHQKNERRHQYIAAAAMAQRYLQSKSSQERAMQGLRATLAFRSTRNLDALRSLTFHLKSNNNNNRNNSNDYDTDHDTNSLRQYLLHGTAHVTGRDKLGRATLVFTPRLVQDHTTSVQGLLWTLERAIACSRYKDEINAIIDFGGFDLWKHSPPTAVGKEMLTLLRNYYVGHVHRIMFLNVSKSVNYVWNIFKVFAGKSTISKVIFVKNNHQELAQHYSEDQLPPSIMETGSYPEFQAEPYFSGKYDCLSTDN